MPICNWNVTYERFGSRVAPLHGITGNGVPEIRVRSFVEEGFFDLIGGGELIHVFAGADSDDGDAGEFLFAIVTTAEFDPWQTMPGDVTGDGVPGVVGGESRVAAWARNSRVGEPRCEYTAERMWRHVSAFRHPPRLTIV